MRKLLSVLLLLSMAALYGCGGGSGTTAPSTVSGTASQGAPLASGTVVTLTDSKGVTKTTTVGDKGAYTVVVDGLTAPFVISAGTFYSFAPTAGVTNINPLTNLSMQLAQGTATVSKTLPANFSTRFAAVVANLRTALSGLYPASMTASTDFLNGNITIGEGVDKVFDTIAITAPDTNGNYAIAVSGQTVANGSTSNGVATVNPQQTAINAISEAIFPRKFTTSMLNGKNFTYASGTPGISKSGSMTFNANSTVTYTVNSDVVEVGKWSVDNLGRVIFIDDSKTVNTITLISVSTNTIRASISYNGTTAVVIFTESSDRVIGGFTASMVNGKSFTYASSGTPGISRSGSMTFNADSTVTYTVNSDVVEAGTWSVDNLGRLIFVDASDTKNIITLTSVSTNTITTSISYNGTTATVIFTESAGTPNTGGVVGGFTASMLSGKTFNYASTTPGIDKSGSMTFNAGSTVAYTVNGGASERGSWSIDSNGKLIFIDISNTVNTITFAGASGNTITTTAVMGGVNVTITFTGA